MKTLSHPSVLGIIGLRSLVTWYDAAVMRSRMTFNAEAAAWSTE
jgi:hypothetical protein